MLTPLQEIEARVVTAIRSALSLESDPAVAPSQNPQFGDYQSNAALQIAGRLKKERGEKANPRQIAEQIIAKFDAGDLLAEPPSIAGPGFINLALAPAFVATRATAALREERLGVAPAERRERVVVEYSSPNIAKQMHVGHIRSTILGDCAARVLEFLGHDVIRQNHVGDWGTQFGMLIVYIREVWASKSTGEFDAEFEQRVDEQGRQITFFSLKTGGLEKLEQLYREAKRRFDEDPVFREAARAEVVKLQAGDESSLAFWRGIVAESMRHIERLYGGLHVELNQSNVRGESAYNDRLADVARSLEAALVAERSEGAIVSFAGGFKAPLMIRKSDGGFGYGTTDLAAAEFRAKELKADRVVYFVDARQAQHFKQVFATYAEAVSKAGWPGGVSFEHASFGSVLGEDGTPIKTREGESVKLADLLDEAERRALDVVRRKNPNLPDDEGRRLARDVGIGAVKYADLSKDRTSDYVFSFDQMLALDGNTAPYLQYAYCRIRSIQEKATAEVRGLDVRSLGVTSLESPHELKLAKHLLGFGDTVRIVARDLRPHVLCTYLYELATTFSGFYENCRVLGTEPRVRDNRLALIELTARTLATGLDLLGIAHPDRM